MTPVNPYLITTLPDDPLGLIAEQLDFNSCINLRQTCHALHKSRSIQNATLKFGQIVADEGCLYRAPSPAKLAVGTASGATSAICGVFGTIMTMLALGAFLIIVVNRGDGEDFETKLGTVTGGILAFSFVGFLSTLIFLKVGEEYSKKIPGNYDDLNLGKILSDDQDYGSMGNRDISYFVE